MKTLVGVDGTDSSVAALRWAGQLAAESGGSVTAVMTWHYPTAMMIPVLGAPIYPADLLAGRTENLLELSVQTADLDVDLVDQQVVMGSPRMVLSEASANHDVLVLGRTTNSRLARLFLGSTGAYCVRHADCPVVVVRSATAPEQGITVAVDGSPSSISALAWAAGLPGDRDIVAAYSHDEWELDELALDDDLRGKLDGAASSMLEDAVSKALSQTSGSDDRITRQVLQGDPRTTLVDQADPSRLLVLGAQGHSGIARWALGSLADYAAHHAPGSVAIWR